MKKLLLLLFIFLNSVTIIAQLSATNSVINVSCSGANNGVAIIMASGGAAPYAYSFNGGAFQSQNMFNNLASGTYNCIVRDNNSDTVSLSAVISQPAALVCNSTLNGNTISVSASGGSAPYSYSIGGSYQVSGVFGSLPMGTYTVQVRDAQGCTCTSSPITINPSLSVIITATLDNPTSTLIAVVNGGTPPYIYQWSSSNGVPVFGANNAAINVLDQGNYSVLVTDALGLTASASYNVGGIPVSANNDTFNIYPINGGIAVSTASVLANDYINSLPVNPNNITLTPLSVPPGFSLNANGTVSVLSGTPSGTYTLTYQICSVASPISIACSSATATISVINNGILLNAFIDFNNNGTQEVGELNFSQGLFSYELNNNGNVIQVASSNGEYLINELNPANSYDLTYTVNPALAAQYTVAPSSYSNVSVVANSGVVTYNFPVTEIAFIDLTVNLYPNGASPRPGFNYINTIVYRNNGTRTIASGTLTFANNNVVTITNVSPSGVTNTPTGFTYDFTNLLPGESRSVYVNMQVPTIPTVVLGQIVTNTASVTIPAGDIYPSNNNSVLTQIIVGSYDPNDKTEAHGGKIVHSTFTSDDYLTYTIQFENTGTANAENVRVKDVLDAKLDEMSIKMIDATHGYRLTRNGNNLNWNFEGIELQPLEKGAIHFQIKPKPGYAVGDIIPNTANIYFDFNPAIVTNTFNTEFVTNLGVSEFENITFKAYPNPTHDFVTITLRNNTEVIDAIIVNDVLGKTIQSKTYNNVVAVVDLSQVSKGIYFVKVLSGGQEKVLKVIRE